MQGRSQWGFEGSVEPLIFVENFFEGAWIIGSRVCVSVAGAVPDPSYHGKSSSGTYNIWKCFLSIPSKLV